MIEHWLWLVPILPWLAAGWIAIGVLFGFNVGERGEKHTSRLMLLASFSAFVILLVAAGTKLLSGSGSVVIHYGTWFKSGEFTANLNLVLDHLSLGIGIVVALIAFLTLRFSVNYMHREKGFQRFFIIMGLFNGAMLLIILAGNALLTFVGWEIAGISSYLLIAYAWDRDTATHNANWALITNRIGDAGFIIAITFSFMWIGNLDWLAISTTRIPQEHYTVLIISGFLIAAMAKSALLPFSAWISKALEGPTPSSAVFYGSLMVHAGVYLLLRLQPLVEQSPAMMWLILVVGALSAIYSYLCGLIQSDIKSNLIFSTSGQIGVMFFSIGMGWFTFAAWHLALHAIWRAYHFLNAPMMMQLMNRNMRPVPRWLLNNKGLYTACLQRFWLDHLTQSLLIRPTQRMAKDVESFDEEFINRLVGLPGSASAISSLAQWEAYREDASARIDGDRGTIGKGHGVLGRSMQWLATTFDWFEQRLILKEGNSRLFRNIQKIGAYLNRIENMLSRPRYLVLMIMITFVVII